MVLNVDNGKKLCYNVIVGENMLRNEVINEIIKFYDYKSYLEIGSLNGENISKIDCQLKQSIDPQLSWLGHIPSHNPTFKMTSDDFFANDNYKDLKWDIIFIDGDHEREQVKRDINNSLERLNEGGTIVCHDMCPEREEQLQPRYCHNSWEAFAFFRTKNEDLEMYVVETDCGCGVIRVGKQETYKGNIESSWNFLVENKKEVLNTISVLEFKKLMEKK